MDKNGRRQCSWQPANMKYPQAGQGETGGGVEAIVQPGGTCKKWVEGGWSENEESSRIFQLVLFRKIGDGENYPFPGSTVKTGGQHHKCPSKWLHFLLQYLLLLLLPYHRTNITSISPSIFAALMSSSSFSLCQRHRSLCPVFFIASPPPHFPVVMAPLSVYFPMSTCIIGFFSPFFSFLYFPICSTYLSTHLFHLA